MDKFLLKVKNNNEMKMQFYDKDEKCFWFLNQKGKLKGRWDYFYIAEV